MIARAPTDPSRPRRSSLWSRTSAAALIGLAVCAWGLVDAQAPRAVRVVSVVPAVTEMLYAMGAGETVVGVTNYDRFPPEVLNKPKVGALLDPNLEVMLALRPTLAVVHASQVDLQRQLARSGIGLFVYTHTGLLGIPEQARAVGQRVGRAEAGEALAAAIERDVRRVRDASAGRPSPRTLLVIGRDLGSLRNILVSGGVGFLHDMLTAAGARNVMADAARENVQVSMETLIARDPDVIVEIGGGSDASTPRQSEVDWRALPPSAAGTMRRVVALQDPDLAIPGPRVAAAIERLAEAVHGPPHPTRP